MEAVWHTRWAIAEGYIPPYSHGPEPQFTSHETACLLNVSDRDAHVQITVFYSDREPVGPYRIHGTDQTHAAHSLYDLTDPEPIPRGTDYACVIESDVSIIVPQRRLDLRQAEMPLIRRSPLQAE
ncbi:MAG: sensory rhodopsin transducer [Nitrospira sp.]|nr:sensory rhodopsin transducer [Nitrospira sp.]